MREDHAAISIIEQGDRVFVRFRMVLATIKFTKKPAVMEQKPFRSELFVDDGKVAVRRGRRCVEPVAIPNSRRLLRAIKSECTAATDPINEVIPAPISLFHTSSTSLHDRAQQGCRSTATANAEPGRGRPLHALAQFVTNYPATTGNARIEIELKVFGTTTEAKQPLIQVRELTHGVSAGG
jgi:hypothetical protein